MSLALATANPSLSEFALYPDFFRSLFRPGLGALSFFTTWKAVYVDYSHQLQRAQIENAE